MRNAFASRTLRVLILAVGSLSCGNAPAGQPAPSPVVATDAAAAAAEAGEASPTPAAEPPKVTSFGVPECDKYVKDFLACVEGKVPAEQKERLVAAFEANRAKWRGLANMREGAIALALACRTAGQKSKDELTVDYGCEF